MSVAPRTSYMVKEQETGVYSFTLRDENGTPVPGSGLDSATLTLYAVPSGAIVNNRSGQNVKNANNVTISEVGVVTWQLQVADTSIVDDTRLVEVHRALFVFTWNTNRRKPHEVDLEIQNLSKLV